MSTGLEAADSTPRKYHRSPVMPPGTWSGDGGLPVWTKIIAMLGFPVVACAAMGWAIWTAGTWTATNILKPAIDTHVSTLEKTTETQAQIVVTIAKIAETQAAQGQAIEQMHRDRQETNRLLRTLIRVHSPPDSHEPGAGADGEPLK